MKFVLAAAVLATLVEQGAAADPPAAAAKGECSAEKVDGCVLADDDTTKEQVCLVQTAGAKPDPDTDDAAKTAIEGDAALAEGKTKYLCFSKADGATLTAADADISTAGIKLTYAVAVAAAEGDDSEDAAQTLTLGLAAVSLAAFTLFWGSDQRLEILKF